MARRWDAEIFNTLHHDKFGVIAAEIERGSARAHAVADFGCGTGIYLPLLARLFAEVRGYERSRACVAIAHKRVRKMPNVTVCQATSASRGGRGRFDVVLCVNVAVHPARRSRASVLRAVHSLLAPGGTLILVVPSLESAAMVALVEREALARQAGRRAGDWDVVSRTDGVVTIEGMPYKHYTRRELRESLTGLGLLATRIRRVEYSWQSQGVRPGPNARGKLPWDWVAVARRGGARPPRLRRT